MLNKKFIAAAFAAAFAVPGVSVAQQAASSHTLTGNLTFTTDVDYKVGVNYLYKGYNFSLAYKDTDAEEAQYSPTKADGVSTVFVGDAAVILSVTKTF